MAELDLDLDLTEQQPTTKVNTTKPTPTQTQQTVAPTIKKEVVLNTANQIENKANLGNNIKQVGNLDNVKSSNFIPSFVSKVKKESTQPQPKKVEQIVKNVGVDQPTNQIPNPNSNQQKVQKILKIEKKVVKNKLWFGLGITSCLLSIIIAVLVFTHVIS